MFQNDQHVLRTIVVDMVKHQGDPQSLINSADRYATSHLPGAQLVWYVRPDQERFLPSSGVKVHQGYGNSDSVSADVREWILEMARNGRAGSVFHVFSYDGQVLDEARDLNQFGVTVVPSPMITFRRNGYRATPSRVPQPFQYDAQPRAQQRNTAPLTLEEAIALAKRALYLGGHTSPDTALRKTQLRLRMIRLDDRAAKNHADPTSANLIALITEDGVNKGWLGMKWYGHEGDELIWVQNEAQSGPAPAERHLPSIAPSMEVSQEPEAARVVSQEPEATKPTEAVEDVAAETASALRPAETRASEERVVKAEKVQPKKEYRSDLMESVLRKRGVGSPPISREYLFKAVEEILSEATDTLLTVTKLTAAARERAIKAYTEDGHTKCQKWPAISECFMRMAVAAGALLNPDGKPVPLGVRTPSTLVKSVVTDFRDRCEGYLVLHIIKEMGDVTDADNYQIGLCLYQRGGQNPMPRDEMLERVSFLLGLLEDEGKIEEQDGRILAL